MMSLTTKGRYGARIMVFLARNAGSRPWTKRQIGDHEGISAGYVEQIMIRLKAAHLVRSHRGRHGGFSLSRSPGRITLAQILRAMEGPVSPVPCLYDVCSRESSCPVRPMWRNVSEAIEEVLAHRTLAEMASLDDAAEDGMAVPAADAKSPKDQ